MTETRVYDPRVSALEEKVSYGTLGILEQFAIQSNTPDNLKKNCLLVNGNTIIRNCHEPGANNQSTFKPIGFDFEQLRTYFEMYAGNNQSVVLFYFHPTFNSMIPEHARKKETAKRTELTRMFELVAHEEHLRPNYIDKIGAVDNVDYYGLVSSGIFSYRTIINRFLANFPLKVTPKIWLISHCPIDYFLFERYPDIEIISSHTGKILTKQDLSNKVFKDPNIPFNRITYKLFGDKDFIKAVCRNKPKAMEQLKGVNLKLKTEKEIRLLAKTKLGIDPKLLAWDL
jgi:hypothetical protein